MRSFAEVSNNAEKTPGTIYKKPFWGVSAHWFIKTEHQLSSSGPPWGLVEQFRRQMTRIGALKTAFQIGCHVKLKYDSASRRCTNYPHARTDVSPLSLAVMRLMAVMPTVKRWDV